MERRPHDDWRPVGPAHLRGGKGLGDVPAGGKGHAVSSNSSRPISIRRISDVPAPIS